MAYTPYEWTVNSYVNPTRMNAIEQGIAAASQAAETAAGAFSTIEELIGTKSIAGIGDGTLTGATWKINNDLSELSEVVTTLNSNMKKIHVEEVTVVTDAGVFNDYHYKNFDITSLINRYGKLESCIPIESSSNDGFVCYAMLNGTMVRTLSFLPNSTVKIRLTFVEDK